MSDNLPFPIPMVSIILPLYNEQDFIWRTLCSIRDQDYPIEKIEVLIVDGMSQDQTRELVNQFIRINSQIKMSLFENPRKVYVTGFNICLQYARGEVIVMMGGHAELAPDYLSRCVDNLYSRGVDCVGGPMQTVANTYMGQSIALAMSSSFGVGGVAFRTRSNQAIEVDTVPFGAYRRSSIERCGYMDEESRGNDDDEYNYRLRKLGGVIFMVPEIHTRYHSRTSLKSLWRQYYRYGLWKVRVLQKHPRQMQVRQFIPPLFVLSLLGSAFLSFFISWFWVVVVLIAGIYILASLVASCILACHKGWRYFPLLPIVFAVLHIGYGVGFLLGLFKFAKRWNDKRGQVPDYPYLTNHR